MNMLRGRLIPVCCVVLFATPMAAQSPEPIRELAKPTASSTRPFGLILNVQQLANGKVLVNDGGSRQLVVLDSLLSSPIVLLDSATGITESYGPRASPLIKYLADSSLFVDGTSRTLLLIAPDGKHTRVVAAPNISILRALSASSSSSDRNGSLIFRPIVAGRAAPLAPQSTTTVLTFPDSVAIARANFDTRVVDTVAYVRASNLPRMETTQTGRTVRIRRIANPLETVDEWGVLTDGSIALVRGHDYHIDWIYPDGTRSSSPKLPFDWRRLTDADKRVLMDSMRAEFDSIASAPPPTQSERVRDGRPPPGTLTLEFVPLSQMGDYQSAIRRGGVKADLDNNLWILPTTSAQSRNGELVYDVVNSKGNLTHRVRLPVGHSIAGFGHGGVVYLMSKEAGNWVLKRTSVLQ